MKPTTLNQVHNQCCVIGMQALPADTVDLVVTSPPYDDLREYHNNNAWNFDFFKQVAREITRVLKPGGVVMWNVNDQVVNGSETGSSFRQALFFHDECGLNIHDTMIYEKSGVAFASGKNSTRYTQKFEYMFVLSKGKPKTINLIADKPNKWAGATSWGNAAARKTNGELIKSSGKTKAVKPFGVRNNIWYIKNQGGFGQSNGIAYKHPATMPEAMARDHIISWSDHGDVVMDPFAGSGTTLRIAKVLNRQFIGFEIDKEYYQICKRLIDEAGSNAELIDERELKGA